MAKRKTRADCLRKAKSLIERNDQAIYNVAANCGQIVGNVKHMHWFVEAVADWLEGTPDTQESGVFG